MKAPTSGGSTGRPKLIVSTQPALVASVEPFARLLGMADGGILITGPLYHNAPFLLSTCAWYSAARRADVAVRRGICLAAGSRAVDYLYAVPTMMGRIWRLAEGSG